MARCQAGFTLLEVLVVLAIIAILAGVAAAFGLGMLGQRGGAEREARQLAALIDHACDQAELTGEDVGIHLSTEAYGFSRLAAEGWRPLADAGSLRLRPWQVPLRRSLAIDSRQRPLAEMPTEPQLVCFAAGLLTPFEITLADTEGGYRVQGRIDGQIALFHFDDRAGREWQLSP